MQGNINIQKFAAPFGAGGGGGGIHLQHKIALTVMTMVQLRENRV